MNPNAYALLLDKVYSVEVIFNSTVDYDPMVSRSTKGLKKYIYLSTVPFAQGEKLVVCVSGEYKIVECVSCEEGIPVNESIEYKWIVGLACQPAHDAHMETVELLKRKVSEIYNKGAQKRMREVLLAELGIRSVAELLTNEATPRVQDL